MDGDITTEPFIKSGFSFGVGVKGRVIRHICDVLNYPTLHTSRAPVAAMLLTSFFDHMRKNIYVKTCIADF